MPDPGVAQQGKRGNRACRKALPQSQSECLAVGLSPYELIRADGVIRLWKHLNLHPNEPHKPPFGLLVLLFSAPKSALGGLHRGAACMPRLGAEVEGVVLVCFCCFWVGVRGVSSRFCES